MSVWLLVVVVVVIVLVVAFGRRVADHAAEMVEPVAIAGS